MPGLLMQLNTATRAWHADVDDSWLQLLSPSVTRGDYLNQLVRTHAVLAPFESACKYTPSLDRYVDFRQLLRAGLIAQDLSALGLSASQLAHLPHCDAITTFADVEEALGWLYVIERVTLLQDGIRRHIVAHLPDIGNACAYLSAFDGRLNEHWEAFGRMLDEAAMQPGSAERISAAALHGFERVQDWFAHHGARALRTADN